MKTKYNAYLRDVCTDVKHWRKHRTKVDIKTHLFLWRNFEANMNLENSELSLTERLKIKRYNSLFNNLNYFYIMEKIIKSCGEEIAKRVSSTASGFEKFKTAKVNKTDGGFSCEFSFVESDKDGNKITRKGFLESKDNKDFWYIFDVKNGQSTDKKRLVKIVVGDIVLDCNSAKHGVKPNNVGVVATIAQNLGLEASDLDDLNVLDIVTAKTMEQKTAAFMCAIAQLPNFSDIATKLDNLAKQAEKETRAKKAVENSYITICNVNGIAVEDYKTAFAITENENEAVQACLISKKTGKTIAQAIEAYRLIFA